MHKADFVISYSSVRIVLDVWSCVHIRGQRGSDVCAVVDDEEDSESANGVVDTVCVRVLFIFFRATYLVVFMFLAFLICDYFH